MPLTDKVVLITGASRGVGAACAVACARAGANLVLASKTVDPHPKLPGTLRDTQRMVEAEGREALVVQCDVRFEGQIQHMVDETIRRFGRLDAVVNNAGAIFWSPIATWPTKKYDLVTQINSRATFLLSRIALPHLRERGGHVINMSPPLITKAAPGKAPYLLSKLGMTLFAMALDAEEKKVHACALWPITGIRTAATVNLSMGDDAEWRKPEILADATVLLLERDPAECSFRAWLDEEVLSELGGVTDMDPYSCVSGSTPTPMSIQLIDPDWSRS